MLLSYCNSIFRYVSLAFISNVSPPGSVMLYERLVSRQIQEALSDTPVVLVIGPRRSGKTTLVQQVGGGGRQYFTFDDVETYEYARQDPAGFVRNIEKATIDEVQRVPEIILAIKRSVDTNPRPGAFLITGSANVMMMPQVGDSLAGRVEIIRLYPLAQCEINGHSPTLISRLFSKQFENGSLAKPLVGDDLVKQVMAGGFPEVLTRRSEERRRRWFENYSELILTRDIRDLAKIRYHLALPDFMRLLAQYSGKLINLSQLGGSIGVSYKTAQDYIRLLELIFLLICYVPGIQMS